MLFRSRSECGDEEDPERAFGSGDRAAGVIEIHLINGICTGNDPGSGSSDPGSLPAGNLLQLIDVPYILKKKRLCDNHHTIPEGSLLRFLDVLLFGGEF